ncbi:DUF177 domain-containing protein [Candidatus Uhrbacteria bacterium]|nr:DUF177 domain-containing protein [Candidatus Uhrbacteria bacterium]
MVFDIDDITEDGLAFRLQVGRDRFKIDQTDCALSQDVSVEGLLRKVNREVFLTGHIKTEVSLICSRCLEPLRSSVDCPVSAKFVPQDKAKKWKSETEVQEDDIDSEHYAENKVDITQPVHDQILLAVPLVPLCRKDCQGLCSECGKNLNNGPCGCHKEKPGDPRLAVLQSLKDKLK